MFRARGISTAPAVRAGLRLAERPRRRVRCSLSTSSSSSSSSSSTSSSDIGARRRTSRIFLSTSVVETFRVPLTLADVHLRREQLPFLYVFRSTLDRDRLVSSLREVLGRYPILGATVVGLPPSRRPPPGGGGAFGGGGGGSLPALECKAGDTVPVSFDDSDLTLDQWQGLEEGRGGGRGTMQHEGGRAGGGAPTISPLFDDLSPARWDAGGDGGGRRDADDDTIIGIPRSAEEGGGGHDVVEDVVSTVRITYFRGHGTAVGINISHLLGDASSCFRFCQVSFGCDKNIERTGAKGG